MHARIKRRMENRQVASALVDLPPHGQIRVTGIDALIMVDRNAARPSGRQQNALEKRQNAVPPAFRDVKRKRRRPIDKFNFTRFVADDGQLHPHGAVRFVNADERVHCEIRLREVRIGRFDAAHHRRRCLFGCTGCVLKTEDSPIFQADRRLIGPSPCFSAAGDGQRHGLRAVSRMVMRCLQEKSIMVHRRILLFG